MLPGLAKRSHFPAISERLNSAKSLRSAHALDRQNCKEIGAKKKLPKQGQICTIIEDSDDIDPDAVKASLSQLLKNLKETERKKEESLTKVQNLQRSVKQLEDEKADLDGKLRNMHEEMNQLRDQKGLIEERLNRTETALTLQVRNDY